MKYSKIIIVSLFILILSLSTCFANDTNKFEIGSNKELVDVSKLYIIEGEGKYAHCKALKGYPGEDKFQVYFQGETYANYITYEDLRGIDLNEIIAWEYEGKTVKSSRKYLYNMFSDTIRLTVHNRDYAGKFSQEWYHEKFGQVYEDWVDGMSFSQDAQTLLKRYFEYKYPSPPNNRYSLRDMKIN